MVVCHMFIREARLHIEKRIRLRGSYLFAITIFELFLQHQSLGPKLVHTLLQLSANTVLVCEVLVHLPLQVVYLVLQVLCCASGLFVLGR